MNSMSKLQRLNRIIALRERMAAQKVTAARSDFTRANKAAIDAESTLSQSYYRLSTTDPRGQFINPMMHSLEAERVGIYFQVLAEANVQKEHFKSSLVKAAELLRYEARKVDSLKAKLRAQRHRQLEFVDE